MVFYSYWNVYCLVIIKSEDIWSSFHENYSNWILDFFFVIITTLQLVSKEHGHGQKCFFKQWGFQRKGALGTEIISLCWDGIIESSSLSVCILQWMKIKRILFQPYITMQFLSPWGMIFEWLVEMSCFEIIHEGCFPSENIILCTWLSCSLGLKKEIYFKKFCIE